MTEIKTIETNGRTLVVVPVPEDSDNHTLYWKFTYQLRYETTLHHDCSIKLSDILDKKEEYRVLGYLTKDEISFDTNLDYYLDYDGRGAYLDYKHDMFGFGSAEQSFRSLLESHNILFTNKFGEKPKPVVLVGGMELLVDNERNRRFAERIKQWNEAQSHVIDKCVILEKI